MAKEISKERLANYLRDQGRYCLFCGSINLHSPDGFDDRDTEAVRYSECHDCGEEWYDVFHLVGVRLVDDPEERE